MKHRETSMKPSPPEERQLPPIQQMPTADEQDVGSPASSKSYPNEHPLDAYLFEAYRAGVNRLNFQDDFLTKINTLFLAVQASLVALASAVVMRIETGHISIANFVSAIAAILGFVTCNAWRGWIRHNGEWHHEHTENLRKLEVEFFPANTRVFSVVIPNQSRRGHQIADDLPRHLLYFWGFTLVAMLLVFGYTVIWPSTIKPRQDANPNRSISLQSSADWKAKRRSSNPSSAVSVTPVR